MVRTRYVQAHVQIATSPYEDLSVDGPKEYWTSPGTPTHGRLASAQRPACPCSPTAHATSQMTFSTPLSALPPSRLVTDSATRNRFREKNARDTWREKMVAKEDLDRLERDVQWTCGYTGHIPRLRDTFAVRNVVAAKFVKADAQDDPFLVASGQNLQLGSPISRTPSRVGTPGGGPRVEGVCGGQRRLVTPPMTKYPGNGFCGTVLPARRIDRASQ